MKLIFDFQMTKSILYFKIKGTIVFLCVHILTFYMLISLSLRLNNYKTDYIMHMVFSAILLLHKSQYNYVIRINIDLCYVIKAFKHNSLIVVHCSITYLSIIIYFIAVAGIEFKKSNSVFQQGQTINN